MSTTSRAPASQSRPPAPRPPLTRQPQQNPQRQMLILGGIIAAVIVVVGIVIALSGQRSPAADIDFTSVPTTRTDDGAYVLGDPNAPITIIEFADYGCPHCQDYHPTMTQFIRDYVLTGQAKFEYRIFPTAGGANSVFTGGITYCAAEQNPQNFWEAYKIFFELAENSLYNQDAGRRAAERLGISYSELLECTNDSTAVQTDVNLGRSVGVEGTPAIRVRYGDGQPQVIVWNGTTYDRSTVPLDVLRAVVQAAQT